MDLPNGLVWIPDSKTASGVAEVPLTDVAVKPSGSKSRSRVPALTCFRIQITQLAIRPVSKSSGQQLFGRLVCGISDYDLRSTYATRLSAGGVADEWVTQLLRQGDARMFKKYSQMKLQMKREALAKLNRKANEKGNSGTGEAA